MKPFTRRRALEAGTLAASLAAAAGSALGSKVTERENPAVLRSPVAVLRVAKYEVDLLAALREGAQLCSWNLRGKHVLIKPNLVEFSDQTCINTDPRLVAAAVELARSLGAGSIRIGEGPGHRRDTWALAEQAGYFREIAGFEKLFVDLNRDRVTAKPGMFESGRIWVAETAAAADVIISMPKVKTHHWAGATLAMKNLFGVVPGAIYGWPKNPLHYLGIDESIAGLHRIFRRTMAIADGIVGMEGNGPIQGTPRRLGAVVMSGDALAADATCARLMGIEPGRLGYIRLSEGFGRWREEGIEERGENWKRMWQPFSVPAGMSGIRNEYSGKSGRPDKAFD